MKNRINHFVNRDHRYRSSILVEKILKNLRKMIPKANACRPAKVKTKVIHLLHTNQLVLLMPIIAGAIKHGLKSVDKKKINHTNNGNISSAKNYKQAKGKKTKAIVKKFNINNKKDDNILGLNKRGPRVASLNAMFKVHLLYETSRSRKGFDEDISSQSDTTTHQQLSQKSPPSHPKTKSPPKSKPRATEKHKQKPYAKKESTKEHKKPIKKCIKQEKVEKKTKKRELPVEPKNCQSKSVKKRKLVDNDVEIIDTRICKRMASLNASAILAASYLPEKVFKRSRSIESSRSIASTVEMIQETKISSSISRVEVPTASTIHTHHDHVVVKSAKTIETVKEVTRMSGKIKDRLVAIEMMERENGNVSNVDPSHIIDNRSNTIINSVVEQTSQSRRKIKSSRHLNRSHAATTGAQASISRPEAAGVTTTEFQVTKVQINTGKATHMKREKMAHQIETILEKDSVEREYQFQAKATTQSYRIQMESSYNQPLTNIITGNTIHTMPCLPVHSSNFSNLHLNTGTNVVQTTPILMSQGLNHGSCFSHSNQPILQIACNASYRPIQPSATISQLPVLNIQPQYPSHYASAFSVPHYTNTAAPSNYSTETYGFYPTGSIVQPIYDPLMRTYPLLKPIPFHAVPTVIRTDQNFSSFTPSSHANHAQSISTIPTQQTKNPPATLLQQPTILTSLAPHINKSTPVNSQMDPLMTPLNNTNSYIIHPTSDLSRGLRSHEIVSHQATLPADVARLPINNNNNNTTSINSDINIANKAFPNQQNLSRLAHSMSNNTAASSIAFIGSSMPIHNLHSHQQSPNIFSTFTSPNITGDKQFASQQILSKPPGNLSTRTNSSSGYCKPATTVITEIFPIKKPAEYKKPSKETQVSITPLVMQNSSLTCQHKDSSSQMTNSRSASCSKGYSISSFTDIKKCDRASETLSNSRTPLSSTASVQTIRVSPPNLSIPSLVNPKCLRKETDCSNPKKSAKRSPTLCTQNPKKPTSTTIQCIPLSNAQQLKKKIVPNNKAKIDSVTPECRVSPNSELSLSKKSNKKRLSHGWTWQGKPKQEPVFVKVSIEYFVYRAKSSLRYVISRLAR